MRRKSKPKRNEARAGSAAEERNLAKIYQSLRADWTDISAALAAKNSTTSSMIPRSWLSLKLARRRRRHAIRLLRSGAFNAEFYRSSYLNPNDARSADKRDLAAAMHYLEEGFCRGFRPNELFDTRWYLDQYEDVRNAGINPLLHYLADGFREGRDPGPGFSTWHYLQANPDVRDADINPLVHYLCKGRLEGRAIEQSTSQAK